MKEEHEKQLKLEIAHIFASGANELRIFEMVESFIDKRQALSQSEGETNIIDKNITFKFKDEHNFAEITLSVKDIWDNIREYVYEKLEDGASNCNCMNESTNHCECSPVFDAFELDSINLTPQTK